MGSTKSTERSNLGGFNTYLDLEIPRFSEFEKGEVSTLFTVKEHGFYVQRWNIVTQYGTH